MRKDSGGSQTSPETLFSYSAAGFLESQTNALGNTTSYTRDALGRILVTALPDPDGAGGPQAASEFAYTYDEVGRELTVTNGLNQTTTNQYDVFGRRTKIIDAELGETDFVWDVAGNLLSLTDPVDNTTTWVYDDLNRMIEETNELNDTRYLSYDAANNLIERIDRNNRKIEFVYDHLHRRTHERWGSNAAFPEVAVSTTTDGATPDEVQRVGFTDEYEISYGSFTLTYGSETTSSIDAFATAQDVQSALEALSNIAAGDVSVTKTGDTSTIQEWRIEFQGALAATNVVQTTIDASNVQGYAGLVEN